MTISLGPIGKVLTDIPPNPRADGYGANPRCLRRDVNKYSSAQTYDNYTYALITKSGGDINKFQQDMLGIPEQNDWGVHMAGHYTIGGDPGGVSSRFLFLFLVLFLAYASLVLFLPCSLTIMLQVAHMRRVLTCFRISFPPQEILSSGSITEWWTESGGSGRCKTLKTG